MPLKPALMLLNYISVFESHVDGKLGEDLHTVLDEVQISWRANCLQRQQPALPSLRSQRRERKGRGQRQCQAAWISPVHEAKRKTCRTQPFSDRPGNCFCRHGCKVNDAQRAV